MSQVAFKDASKTRMTVDEFLEFCARPENFDRNFELIRGEVVELPNPNIIHGVLCSNISAELTI